MKTHSERYDCYHPPKYPKIFSDTTNCTPCAMSFFILFFHFRFFPTSSYFFCPGQFSPEFDIVVGSGVSPLIFSDLGPTFFTLEKWYIAVPFPVSYVSFGHMHVFPPAFGVSGRRTLKRWFATRRPTDSNRLRFC